MSFVDYGKWANYINSIIKKYVDRNSLILELAAGTGIISSYLLELYPNIIISDLSCPMLKKVNPNVERKICCNMLFLPFKKQFDLIFLTYDSINYITSKKDLKSFFHETYKILNNNGILTFDAALKTNSLKNTSKMNMRGKIKNWNYERINYYNERSGYHYNKFKINKDGKTYIEVHKEKIYNLETFIMLADEAGFNILSLFNAFTKKAHDEKTERIQIVLQKRV